MLDLMTDYTHRHTCLRCWGAGRVWRRINRKWYGWIECPDCQGEGYKEKE